MSYNSPDFSRCPLFLKDVDVKLWRPKDKKPIINQGEPADQITILHQGLAFEEWPESRRKTANLAKIINAPAILGVDSLIEGVDQTATRVVPKTDCYGQVVAIDDFLDRFYNCRQLRDAVLINLAGRIRATHELIGVHNFATGPDRILYSFSQLADQHGIISDFSQSELAPTAGISRPIFSTYIRRMKRMGLLEERRYLQNAFADKKLVARRLRKYVEITKGSLSVLETNGEH